MKNKRLKIQVSRFKILSVIFLLSWILQLASASHATPIFGDGTSPRDTIWISFTTFDTSGYAADCDSYFIRRFHHGSLVDSTFGLSTNNKVRTGFYSFPKRALDGSNCGQYNVEIEWWKDGKKFKKSFDYMVVKGGIDSTKVELAGITHTGAVIPTVTSVTNNVDINSNSDITAIKNQTDKFLFDLSNHVKSTPQTGVTVTDNNDKTGYSLVSQDWLKLSDLPIMADTFWLKDTADYKDSSETMGEYLLHKPSGGAAAQQVWEYQGEITLQDTIPKVYAVNVGGETDPDSIANHVWSWSTRTLTTGSGSGANQVTIKVLQSADSAEIVAAQVQVLNLTQTSTLGLLTTNAKGCAVFALDNDTLLVRIYKPGWVFAVPETLKVLGDTDTTYYGTEFDPGYPPASDLCRVYGWVKDINDLPVSGAKVQAKIDVVPLRYQNVLISPYYKETTADSEGYWYLDLFPNSLLNPDTTSYTIFIYGSGGIILNLKTTVPDQSSWELSF